MLLIQFSIEVILSFVVLKVAFNLTGFPSLTRQLLPISILIALSMLGVDHLVGEDSFFIRNLVAFAVSYNLIKWLTDAKDWELAMTIAIAARVVTAAISWALLTFNLIHYERF